MFDQNCVILDSNMANMTQFWSDIKCGVSLYLLVPQSMRATSWHCPTQRNPIRHNPNPMHGIFGMGAPHACKGVVGATKLTCRSAPPGHQVIRNIALPSVFKDLAKLYNKTVFIFARRSESRTRKRTNNRVFIDSLWV